MELRSISKCSTTFATTLILRAISPSAFLLDASSSGIFRLIPYSSKWLHRYWKFIHDLYTSMFWALGLQPSIILSLNKPLHWWNHAQKSFTNSLLGKGTWKKKYKLLWAWKLGGQELKSRDLPVIFFMGTIDSWKRIVDKEECYM